MKLSAKHAGWQTAGRAPRGARGLKRIAVADLHAWDKVAPRAGRVD